MKDRILGVIGLGFTALSFLVGGIMWLTEIHAQGKANAADISDLKHDSAAIWEMRRDVAVIRVKVEALERRSK